MEEVRAMQPPEPARTAGYAPPLGRLHRRGGATLRRQLRCIGLPYLFLTPFLLLFALFFILPLGYALGISLFADRLVGGTVFVGGLLWGYLYGPNFGPFAQLASALRLPAPGFLTTSGMLPSIGNIVTWQWTGYNMVILYAALQAVSPELYDAATVHGGGGRTIARYIKIPLIPPPLVLAWVFSV